VALIGVEHWHAGMHAAAAWAQAAEIVGCWSSDARRAADFAALHGTAAFAELEPLLQAAPDLAVVMGRPAEIAERGLAAIEAGIPVLLEKPVGTTAAASDALAEAAGRTGGFAAVALPHGLGMKEALAELDRDGRLGPLSHSHFRLINGPPQRYVDDGVGWVLERAVGGGGALRNLGIHGVAGFLALVGRQEVRVESATLGRPLHGTEVEDYAAVVLRAADGTVGIVEAGYTHPSMKGGTFAWRVSARNATLVDRGDRISVATLDDEGRRDRPATPLARRYEDGMGETLARLRDGRQPAVSLAECRRAMAIIDACYARQDG
jgi:predicted dehydrogenase